MLRLSTATAARSAAPIAALVRPSSTFTERNRSVTPVVLVDAVRTPFQQSGTGFEDLSAYDLTRNAISGLLRRTAVDPSTIDRVIVGNVIQEVRNSNIARDAALGAGIPNSVPANTVTLACISSNLAITTGMELIRGGQATTILAGGVETMSDVPIRFSRPLRKRLLATRKIKSPAGYLKLLSGLSAGHFVPEAPAIAEFTSGESMGQSADRLAARWGVSRADSDAYAVKSHVGAARASHDGLLSDVVAVRTPKLVSADNVIRSDSSVERLATLRPAFIRPHGTVTAGNSSALTDGASAALVMSETAALASGYKPRAYLRDYMYVAQDPKEELLLGPAYGMARLLHRNGLTLNDVGVFEMHEAFAGQVLACLNALASDSWVRETARVPQSFGRIPMEQLNAWGGSLSLGHPFGATGVRLVAHAANRLIHEDKQIALIAACAAGGQAHAMLVERYPN